MEPSAAIATARDFLNWVANVTDNAKAPENRQHGNRPR